MEFFKDTGTCTAHVCCQPRYPPCWVTPTCVFFIIGDQMLSDFSFLFVREYTLMFVCGLGFRHSFSFEFSDQM